MSEAPKDPAAIFADGREEAERELVAAFEKLFEHAADGPAISDVDEYFLAEDGALLVTCNLPDGRFCIYRFAAGAAVRYSIHGETSNGNG